ncbi:MAG TPA: helix-turn-helix transcriptional regulator [Candidatus Limnocylindria bacterium]|nr:helix-turn-helix transcriptional regulator [Candidatus Limnocylindria bacterium]
MVPEARRRALGDFVRAQRARLAPMSAGRRRRTPGLRREEVAQLCEISPTWYTWIEQGRRVSVSPAVLARLAQALQLSPAERAYLFELAEKRDPNRPHADDSMDASPAIVAAIEATAVPAYLLDRLWNVRAWNAAASRLFVGWLDAPGEPNLLRYLFLHPAARALVRDWDERARRVVAEFRADSAERLDDPQLQALVAELRSRSSEFARAWDEYVVTAREGGERTFDHPTDGVVRYEQIALHLANRPELKLIMLSPQPR